MFVVPDGALNLVNLSGLPTDRSAYLIEREPLIHYLSAERDLVKEATEFGKGLFVLGFPAFDDSSLFAALDPVRSERGSEKPYDDRAVGQDQHEASVRAIERTTPEITVNVRGAVAIPRTDALSTENQGERFRGQRSSCGNFTSLRFEPLPASNGELDDLVAAWTRTEAANRASLREDVSLVRPGESHPESKGLPGVLSLRGREATEAGFKDRAPGRRILHLATHGFFLGESCPSMPDHAYGRTPRSEDNSALSIAVENPLVLAGLALAGVNHREAAGPGEEDGVLTAEEIASLDLSGTEWAVLSACDTGLGAVKDGEGVFGLRRAFQLAGAKTVIMSLGPVEDKSGRKWMADLYRHRLSDRMSTADSVREASLGILTERRALHLTTHPFYWAEFVAVGDWR